MVSEEQSESVSHCPPGMPDLCVYACVRETDRQMDRQEDIPGCSQNCVGEDAFKFVIPPPFYHVGTKRTEPRALCF